MKKILIILTFLLISTYSYSYAKDLAISGEAGILIDMDSGQILYEKNSNLKLFPASTTKIMTAILALELGNMDDMVTVDQEVVNLTDGSHIALEPDEKIKLEYLVNALLIESANDSALAIAKHISGSIEDFVKLMNKKAKEIGAINTNFINPNGLHDDVHISTAQDLAVMAKYAMNNENFRKIVSNYTYTIPPTNKKTETRYLKSANKLLYSNQKINVDGKVVPIKYEGATGIKTGYTTIAQNCLVASVEKGNQRLLAVVLKSSGRNIYLDLHRLFNYGFNNFEKVSLGYKNEFVDNINIKQGKIPIVAGVLNNDISVSIQKKDKSNIQKQITIDENLVAPIEKGQSIGHIDYFLDKEKIGEVDIISTLSIEQEPTKSIFLKLLEKWYVLTFIMLIIGRSFYIIKKKKRRRKKSNIYDLPNTIK